MKNFNGYVLFGELFREERKCHTAEKAQRLHDVNEKGSIHIDVGL